MEPELVGKPRLFEIDNHMEILNNRLENEMNQYWQERSESYSQQNIAQFNSDCRLSWEHFIFNGITETSPLNILDIGTGPGVFAIIAALRGHKVTAVDMNEKMLAEAMQNAKKIGACVDFRQVGHVLPFEDETFDLIISRDVTWTLTEPENQLEHWARKLKKNGILRYFDAEWYYYLRNSNDREKWEESKQDIIKNNGFIYRKAGQLEKVAVNLPMTYRERPEWDENYWKNKKNYSIDIQCNINPHVYSPKDQMQYKLFPEFLVTVRRNF